jgi:hypothetical protein
MFSFAYMHALRGLYMHILSVFGKGFWGGYCFWMAIRNDWCDQYKLSRNNLYRKVKKKLCFVVRFFFFFFFW